MYMYNEYITSRKSISYWSQCPYETYVVMSYNYSTSAVFWKLLMAKAIEMKTLSPILINWPIIEKKNKSVRGYERHWQADN